MQDVELENRQNNVIISKIKGVTKMDKKKRKKKKIVFLIILLVGIIGSGIGAYFYFQKEEPLPEPKKIEVLDKINGFDYSLEDRDTALYKETFLELKKTLESETYEDQTYAELLAKLFVIDLYTMDNKISKYDVGSLDFIYPEEKEKFQNKVLDTMYKLIEDNSYNTRKQELPVVKEVEILKTEETKYKKGNTNLEGYIINVAITYEKELGYDKKMALTLVKEDNKIYIVQTKTLDA